MSGNRRQEDLELLRRAIDAQTEDAPRRGSRRRDGQPSQMMYRGQPVNGRGGGRTPGAPGGGGPRHPGRPVGGGASDVRAALEELADMHADGLISKADYDRKRSEILDRM